MPKALLDTEILSEYLKGHDRVVIRRAADYARRHGAFTFTSVTVHEIVYGLELKGATAQLQRALLWLNQNEQITPHPPIICKLPPSRPLPGSKARSSNFLIV